MAKKETITAADVGSMPAAILLPPGYVPPPPGGRGFALPHGEGAKTPPHVRLVPKDGARTFARVADGVVAGLIQEHLDVDDEWHPDFLETCVDVTGLDPVPQQRWVRGEDGKFSPPPVPVLSPAQQMALALGAGLTVASTSTSAVSATYDGAGPKWEYMSRVFMHVTALAKFPAGRASLDWIAKSGKVTFPTVIVFMAVVEAISDWEAARQAYADGMAKAAPAATVTIA